MEKILRAKATLALASALFALSLTHAAESKTTGAAKGPRPAAGRTGESVRSGTVTAPDGQVALTSIDRKWDEKSGTGTLNEAAVTPDGRIYSREANLTRNPDGTVTTKGTFTDFDGRSFNYTETTKRTSAGPTQVGRMIDIDGTVFTYETTSARTADHKTKRVMVMTHPDGSTETRMEILATARTVAGI